MIMRYFTADKKHRYFMSDTNKSQVPDILMSTPITAVALFLLLLFIGLLLFFFTSIGIGYAYGFDLQVLNSATNPEDFSVSERNFLRSTILLQHLFTFILPGILTAILMARSKWLRYLLMNKLPDGVSTLLATAIIFVAFPLVQFTFFLNKSLPLPDWAREMEASTEAMINGILQTNSPWELLFNLLVIAVIPAIGEEIVFRGLLQDGLQKRLRNPHLAIWLAAIVFSGFHLQFEGFIPRLFLGAVLGYLFYWTNNLWVPIIAHLINNGAQIIAQHLYKQEMTNVDLEQMDHIPIPVVVGSALLLAGLSYILYQRQERSKKEIPLQER
jgi:membrane protease YdiL (CAAX protease family)